MLHFVCVDFESRHSPVSVAHFSQHHLGPLLYERAQRLGQKVRQVAPLTIDHGPVLMGHECVSIASNTKSVNVKLSASQVNHCSILLSMCFTVIWLDLCGGDVVYLCSRDPLDKLWIWLASTL